MARTDRQKLIELLDLFDVEVEEREKSITAGHRRYYFNAAGEIEKILTYHREGKPTIARSAEEQTTSKLHGRQEDAS